MKTNLSAVLVFWFIAVFAAAYAGFFISKPGRPPLAVGIAFAAPLTAFVFLFTTSDRFRESLSLLPPVLLISLHGWRFVGMGFIMAYYRGLLPPGFAWPAGIGDMAVAFFTPYIAYRVALDPTYLGSKTFLLWNGFGIVDFLSAVGLGVAHQASPRFFHTTVDTGLMQELPFALIPCFFVPLLGITHLILLHQARQTTFQPASTSQTRGAGS